MTRNAVRALWALGMIVGWALLIGCAEKKPDSDAPAPTPTPTPEPGPNPAPGDPHAALGEPKFKLKVAEFVKEYTDNYRTANSKYIGQVVELTGNTTELASVETDAAGNPLGKASERKAAFVMGEPNAKRVATVRVRGLKLSVIGQVFKAQQVTVKGRVGKYDHLQPVELLNAEVVSASKPSNVEVTVTELTAGAVDLSALARRAQGRTAVFSGTIGEKTSEAGVDTIEIKKDGRKVKCRLAPGIPAVFPSVVEKGKAVTLAGTLTLQKDKIQWWIEVQDCVPVGMAPRE